jgi:hypothetical protein
MEQRGDCGNEIFSGSEPRDQPLGRRTGFWGRTLLPRPLLTPREGDPMMVRFLTGKFDPRKFDPRRRNFNER